MPDDRPQDRFADSLDQLVEQANSIANGLQVQGRGLSDDEQRTISAMLSTVPLLEQAAAILRKAPDMPNLDISDNSPREALAREIENLLADMNQAVASIEIQGRALMPDELQTIESIREAEPLLRRALETLRE